MKREDVAKRIHWQWIIWCAGLVNVGAMLPQLAAIWRAGNVEGLALEMFVLYLLIQIAFAIEGFFARNRMLTTCMGLSAVVSALIIGSVAYLRYC